MNIACPYCKAGLTPKGLKPGKYTPKCPKCGKSFGLVVPVDETGTILIQPIAQKKPDPNEVPDTKKVPSSKPQPKTSPLPAVGSQPPKAAPKPAAPKKPLSPEEIAAALLDGKDPDEMTESEEDAEGGTEAEAPAKPAPKADEKPLPQTKAVPIVKPGAKPAEKPLAKTAAIPVSKDRVPPKPADPNVTGDFTQADKGEKSKHDPHATGNFTEVEEAAPPKPAAKPAPKSATKIDPHATGDFTQAEDSPKVDPNATGDFTDVKEGGAHAPASDATGDFTDAGSGAAAESAADAGGSTDPNATGDHSESAAEPDDKTNLGGKAPAKKAKPKLKADADGAADEDVPPRLGGYEVLKVLGKGGMGAVLLGRQISLDRKVALKVMHPKIAKNASFVARFTREAYAAAQLTHHNVVQIYDIGEDRGQHFFSMEYVQGQSLMDIVKKEGKVSPETAVGYILQAARGLRYGHNQGMIHRDIKPDNLMINTEGIVKVADLGLVKLPGGELPEQAGALPPIEDDSPGDSNLTRAGAVMGTPAYMSPEQSRDSATVDARADVYSLGCTFYVLVTGKTPFEGKTAMEIISKHQSEPMKPPELLVKRIPKALSGIILKMTAKKPEERYQSMDEVITALEGFLGLEKSGTFNPKEEQADQLEKCCHQFNFRSKSGLKKSLTLGFFAACLLGIVGSAFAGKPELAGGLLGLMLMTPLAYFAIHGTFSGSLLFSKTRQVLFGMRFFDMLMWFVSGLLFVTSLYLFGLLWSWLGFAALAAGLGFLLWFLTDRSAAKGQASVLEEARLLFRSMRLAGWDEEQLRQFVCKFSGTNWEPFYEALFGYEAKLAARAYRKGDTGEVSKKAGAWREPLIAFLDGKLEARRTAKERKHLQKIEAKALEAAGVSRADAKAQAEEMAADLVGQATEAKQAKKEGKEVSVKQMVTSARDRKPKPGTNIAGKQLRSLWFKDFLNEWMGRRLRLVLGAVVFAIGLLWMNQNQMFDSKSNIFKQVMEMDFTAAKASLDRATGKPLQLSFLPIPAEVLQPISSVNVPILGFLMILSGACFFGWRPTLVAVPGLILGIAGPMLGVPAVGPLSAEMLCLAVGAVLIIFVAWLVRQ